MVQDGGVASDSAMASGIKKTGRERRQGFRQGPKTTTQAWSGFLLIKIPPRMVGIFVGSASAWVT